MTEVVPQEPTPSTDLPANSYGDLLTGIPAKLTPSCIKALDRLITGLADIPLAYIERFSANIRSKTASMEAVENKIGGAVAERASQDDTILTRAAATLVRSSYRKQNNREKVAKAAVHELKSDVKADDNQNESSVPPPIDDDWLNIFEQHAENASTERMQNLWGKVLAGEIRKPGQYSLRTLRFLSEFSANEAKTFETLAHLAFAGGIPESLCDLDGKDITKHLCMEVAGLIQGVTGLGLTRSFTFDGQGLVFIKEGEVYLCLQGAPGTDLRFKQLMLTPLGQELLSLISTRDIAACAKTVAFAIRRPEIKGAYLGVLQVGSDKFHITETLWKDPSDNSVSPSA